MSRFQRSWALFKQSFKVIGGNKKLLVFPVIITFFSLIIILFFVLPVVFQDTGSAYDTAQHWKTIGGQWVVESKHGIGANDASTLSLTPLAYFAFFIIYLVSMFLATFFNVAFYNEILNALNGNKVFIIRGFKFAFSRIPQILVWSLLAGIVGLLIKQLEQRLGFVGAWLVRLLGIGWSIASVFVIPVIIREQKSKNPIKYLKDSALILKKTWGESLAGYVGINFIGGALTLTTLVFVIGLIVGIAFAGGAFESVLLVSILSIILGVGLLCSFLLHYILHVANHVYRCALFIYASEGIIPQHYTHELMETAWKLKAGRKKQ